MNNTEKNVPKKKLNFSGAFAFILALLVLAIAIPINLIVSYFDYNIDMTPSQLYSLTDTSKKLLESTKDKTIEFTILCELEDIKEIDEYLPLYYALEQYQEYENIEFNAYYPDEYPERVKELNPDGFFNLSTGDIVIKCGDFSKKISSSKMFVDIYDDNGKVIEQKYVGENLITGAIKTVTEGIIPQIYFLTGHGEKTISEYYNYFSANLNNYNYSTSELNLAEAGSVPDDAAVIFITAPQEDITLAEKKMLLEYAEKGGNMILLMSPNAGEFRYSNLEDLMYEYNIAMDYNRIYETNKEYHIEDDPYTIYVNLPSASDDATVDLTSELNSIIESGIYPYMCETRTFKTVSGPNSGVLEVGSLMQTATTADDSGNYVSSVVSETYGGDDPDLQISGVLDMAYYSYNSQNYSKMIVMGNAEFMDDEHVASGYTLVPLYLCLSSITWMYNSDIDMEIDDKERSFDYMYFETSDDAQMIMGVMIALPAIMAVLGIAVWLKRRNS